MGISREKEPDRRNSTEFRNIRKQQSLKGFIPPTKRRPEKHEKPAQAPKSTEAVSPPSQAAHKNTVDKANNDLVRKYKEDRHIEKPNPTRFLGYMFHGKTIRRDLKESIPSSRKAYNKQFYITDRAIAAGLGERKVVARRARKKPKPKESEIFKKLKPELLFRIPRKYSSNKNFRRVPSENDKIFGNPESESELVKIPPTKKFPDRVDLSELTRLQNQPIGKNLQSIVDENFAKIRSKKIKILADKARKASTANRKSTIKRKPAVNGKTHRLRESPYCSALPVTKGSPKPREKGPKR